MSGSSVLLLFLISTIIFLLMGGALMLFVMRYQKRMMAQAEDMKKQEADFQDVLLKAAIKSQEQERERIAGNLHDGLGATLSSIRLGILMHGQETPESASFANETAQLLSETVQEVREISHNLMPSTLKQYGLASAWRDLLNPLNNASAMRATFTESGTPIRLPAASELAIFRITQELLNNSLRHAQGTELGLTAAWETNLLTVTYHDNGKGFDAQANSKGLGLYNLQSRAQSLNADLQITSAPNQGMRCTLTCPLT